MSSALKLEPRCPDPARFTATSAFSRQMSASSARRRVGLAVRDANSVDVAFVMNASVTARDGNRLTSRSGSSRDASAEALAFRDSRDREFA